MQLKVGSTGDEKVLARLSIQLELAGRKYQAEASTDPEGLTHRFACPISNAKQARLGIRVADLNK